MLELMEAICNPLAEIGCEDILHITQSKLGGGWNFSPLFLEFFPGWGFLQPQQLCHRPMVTSELNLLNLLKSLKYTNTVPGCRARHPQSLKLQEGTQQCPAPPGLMNHY